MKPVETIKDLMAVSVLYALAENRIGYKKIGPDCYRLDILGDPKLFICEFLFELRSGKRTQYFWYPDNIEGKLQHPDFDMLSAVHNVIQFLTTIRGAQRFATSASQVKIRHQDTGTVFVCDQDIDLECMRRSNPLFFSNKVPRGRETYMVYRGCLIVRKTAHFTHGSERRTVVYLYVVEDSGGSNNYFHNLCAGSDIANVREAKALINRMHDTQRVFYGM